MFKILLLAWYSFRHLKRNYSDTKELPCEWGFHTVSAYAALHFYQDSKHKPAWESRCYFPVSFEHPSFPAVSWVQQWQKNRNFLIWIQICNPDVLWGFVCVFVCVFCFETCQAFDPDLIVRHAIWTRSREMRGRGHQMSMSSRATHWGEGFFGDSHDPHSYNHSLLTTDLQSAPKKYPTEFNSWLSSKDA